MEKSPPYFSVIVPAYNEATLLPLLLSSLEDQSFRGGFEVIVVDNNSSDRTAAIAKAFGVKVISEKKQGPMYARRAGFAAAKGEVLVSTDADCIVPPDWLSSLAKEFRRQSVDAVAGGLELNNLNTLGKQFIRLFVPVVMLASGRHFSGANFAVRREAYDAVGGFDPNHQMMEDWFLADRLIKGKKRIKVKRGLKVQTSARRFDRRLWRTIGSYIVNNWLNWLLFRRPYLKELETIREKPFDISKRIVKRPVVAAIIILLVLVGVYESFNPRLNIYSQSRAVTNQKIIALTFDDGPSDPYTEQILGILAANDVKATFFMVGENVKRHPDIAKDVAKSGNLIGNHSNNHNLFSLAQTPGAVKSNVGRAQQAIFSATGLKPHFYRPPYGFRTAWGAKAIRDDGYFAVTWNDMTYDYWPLPPDKISRNIIKNARPGGIIVLHDGKEAKPVPQRANVVAALPAIIQTLKAQGYRFVTLDELFDQAPYR